jgi:hypothetical protein
VKGAGGASGATGTGGAAGGPATGGATGTGGAAGVGGHAGATGTGGTGTGGTGTGGTGTGGGTGGTVGCSSNGDCSGTCMMCNSSHLCVAATNQDDPNGRCAGTCDSSGACKSKQGQLCNATAGRCIGTTVCSPDGYCCDKACTGSCEACDLQGFQGTCTNLAANAAPHSNHPACAGSGTCAGSCGSAGVCIFPTVTCGSPSCSGTQYVDSGVCSGGNCGYPPAQTCNGNFVCAANACKTSCTADADCVSTSFCEAGTCHLKATAVSCGANTNCVLLANGTLRCWGDNTFGELGNGMTSSLPVPNPVAVTGLPGPAQAVAAGTYQACALLVDGDVWCWGLNSSGQLGNGDTTVAISPVPLKVVGLGQAATAIAVGVQMSGAILADGSVSCWGADNYGQLGDGNSSFSATALPVSVSLPDKATGLALGKDNGCASVGAGYLYCWGWDNFGTVGNLKYDSGIYGPTATGIQDISPALGLDFACALQAGGAVQCWGYNSDGELGNGTLTTTGTQAIATPHFVNGLTNTAESLSALGTGACATTTGGTIICWGNGNPTPGPVATLKNPAAISGNCALLSNGSVWTWSTDLGTVSQVPGW